MTFDEACELARVIEGTSRFTVIAIGRFVLLSELAGAHAGGFIEKLPWAVSAMLMDDPKYHAVLRSEGAWREFVACSQRTEPVHVAPTPASSASTTRAEAKPGQLSLF